jgi:hypothetical protein
LIFLVYLGWNAALVAQSNNPHANSLFLELGGVTASYSMNYARYIFSGKVANAYFRAGASVWKDQVTLPLGLSLMSGATDHHLELNLVVAPISEGLAFWDRAASDIKIDLVLGLGYRYQPQTKSFFISGGLYPYLTIDPTSTTISEQTSSINFRPGISAGCFLR